MTTSRWHYAKELAEQLRINGVPEPQVRDIVAQVEGHAAATGEDLVDAFGQPVDYAAQWRSLSPRRWIGQVLLGGVPALGVASGVKAMFAGGEWSSAVALDRSDLTGFLVMFAVVGLVPWTVGLTESRRRAAALGSTAVPSVWPYRVAVPVVFGIVVALVTWALGGSASTLLVEVPRWVLAVVGVVGISSVVFLGPAPNSAGQLPDRPWAPPHSWRTRVRRAFINR
ncbi:hypothetical protein [Knoellia aerolata]|uniref:Uncharacterized protein n=1 Tax=Knoellia aerolata DSM 18566 TaxID=1385519 RepID=A0A0A0JZ60_9MICO|nr:hypothetical protein [Knoellia aerolata]KGN42448.1 hypothetical protein N801_17450 [Knoellia aerolata DSM 18566]